MVTGIRWRRDSTTQPRPMVTETTARPDAACCWLAPTAVSPVRSTAKDDVNPTSAVTTPATTVWDVPALVVVPLMRGG